MKRPAMAGSSGFWGSRLIRFLPEIIFLPGGRL
jgi:hypothetical protein